MIQIYVYILSIYIVSYIYLYHIIYIYYMIQIYAMEYIKKNDRDLYVPTIRQDQ